MLKSSDIKRLVTLESLFTKYGSQCNSQGRWRCPFRDRHNHGDASSSVSFKNDRATCHSQGCFQNDDIFGVVGKVENLPTFKEQQARLIELFHLDMNGKPMRNSIRVYEWTDSEGRKAYHHRCEAEGAKFGWNQKDDGTGKATLAPCQPDLYQREQVIAAKTVIVCAGERDAETINQWLKELELFPETVATTPHTGESSVKAESFHILHGKETVYVVGDNDKTGQSYRKNICRFLQGHVGKLNELFLPNAFNDITEWMEQGGTAHDIQALLSKAEAYHSTEDATELLTEHPGNLGAGQGVLVEESESNVHKSPAEAVQWLARLPTLEYAQQRTKEAKALKIPVAFLDQAVDDAKTANGGGKASQGTEITFPDIRPTGEPVDGHILPARYPPLPCGFSGLLLMTTSRLIRGW